jgi:hypothetical protein
VTDLHKRLLESTGFDDDEGGANARLDAVLAAHRRGEVDRYTVYPVLAGARVLAPVVAVLGEAESAGDNAAGVALRRDKDSEMALVTLVAGNGAKAVPMFTATERLAAWAEAAGFPAARPVPVAVEKAAAATLQEEADVLLLDLGTPQQFSLTGVALRAFAAGRVPLRPEADPEITAALTAVLRSIPQVAEALQTASVAADTQGAVLHLGFAAGTDTAALAEPLRTVAQAVSDDPLLRDRLGDGLSITASCG